MIEANTFISENQATAIENNALEASQLEAAELPDKIGELSEVEALPDKIELINADDNSESSDSGFDGGDGTSDASPDGVNESDYPSSYKERIDRTPSENSDRGDWTGERGESTFIPNDEEMQDLLDQFDIDGIEYKDGIPDFSPCAETTVKIDNMSEKRYGKDGNFAQCDEKCAEQWNKEGRDGKTDWTARDVQEWREQNGYTWHERNDMETCDLVPSKVNDYFGHLGGVSECKKSNATQDNGGDFDD